MGDELLARIHLLEFSDAQVLDGLQIVAVVCKDERRVEPGVSQFFAVLLVRFRCDDVRETCTHRTFEQIYDRVFFCTSHWCLHWLLLQPDQLARSYERTDPGLSPLLPPASHQCQAQPSVRFGACMPIGLRASSRRG